MLPLGTYKPHFHLTGGMLLGVEYNGESHHMSVFSDWSSWGPCDTNSCLRYINVNTNLDTIATKFKQIRQLDQTRVKTVHIPRVNLG